MAASDRIEPRRPGDAALPLAVTLAAHALLFLAWATWRTLPARSPSTFDAAGRLTLLLAPHPSPAKPVTPPLLSRPREAVNFPLASPTAPALVAAAKPVAEAELPAIAAPGSGSIVARALSDAGKVDRQLRGAKAVISSPDPNSRMQKLERGIAAAFVERGSGFTLDRYTAADGVIITRQNTAGGAVCYMSGTVNFVPGILHNSNRPQKVACPPADAGWVRQ